MRERERGDKECPLLSSSLEEEEEEEERKGVAANSIISCRSVKPSFALLLYLSSERIEDAKSVELFCSLSLFN